MTRAQDVAATTSASAIELMERLTYNKNRWINDERWSIYIDVEGFSTLIETDDNLTLGRALGGLHLLAAAIFRIGAKAYPGLNLGNPIERLNAHQFGDGFLIVPDLPEDSAERPLLICIAIMRALSVHGVATKAAISFGSLSDVQGLHPNEIVRVARNGNVPLGEGIMTTVPVLGTALTRAYALGGRAHGPLLLIDHRVIPSAELPAWLPLVSTADDWGVVNWVRVECEALTLLAKTAGLPNPPFAEVEAALRNYINTPPTPPKRWREGTLALLRPHPVKKTAQTNLEQAPTA